VLESAFSGNCTCQYERLCVLAKPHQKDWRSKYLDQLTGHMEEASESKHHAKMTVRSLRVAVARSYWWIPQVT
jgi:hypothetical protein